MILVDTSVVIDALRSLAPKWQQLFVAHQAAICGVILAEVLHGARDALHYQQLTAALAKFPYLDMSDNLWATVGQHLYNLRRNGVTIPLADVIIATLAISHGVELWTRDAHFATIQTVLPGLQLFPEPP